VTGIINGTGSLGAAIGQFVIAVISERFGWATIFYILISLGGVACIILMPNGVNDCRAIHRIRMAERAAAKEDEEAELNKTSTEKDKTNSSVSDTSTSSS